ncbi:hypothetical protein AB870_21960 [Pandoraea faecigallinarum]|uniref:Toxin n=1 Tax=Pandoraea faecigallinarum TaxID=656179 RepID=A0A173GZV2_9BURK|nr:RHS repeat-associated core domain-containing protein [Pandoraea faecigallinarum]ANI21707.1 hypothetical protein AB870_21960 [Pandoraea faecigallinarum]
MTTIADDATVRRCAHTPTVTALDARALICRTVRYNRASGDDDIARYVSRQTWTVRGHHESSTDPRGSDAHQDTPASTPNFRYHRSLSGQPLAVHSADAGARFAIYDAARNIVWQQDGRGQQIRHTYDAQGRPLTVTEQRDDAPPRTTETLIYADATGTPDDNLRGQLIAHWSPAGLTSTPRYSMTQLPLDTDQRFLRDDVPESHWAPGEEDTWPRDLDAQTWTTTWSLDALGNETGHTNASGHSQRLHFDVAGQLCAGELQMAGSTAWLPVLRAVEYAPSGLPLREDVANGVTTLYEYEPQTDRLSHVLTTRPAAPGRRVALQTLAYVYDPVGNRVAIENTAPAGGRARQRRVDPENRYTLDALYRLIEATGTEDASLGQQGMSAYAPGPSWPSRDDLTPYTRTYDYDRAGNLVSMHHKGSVPFTTEMVVAPASNRAVVQTGDIAPDEVDAFFDACGNLRELDPGRPLTWNCRNQLRRVAQVSRAATTTAAADDDDETYWYDADGARATKLTRSLTSRTTRLVRVRYLPGLELRQTEQIPDGATQATPVETLDVIRFEAGGRAGVTVLHWQLGKPEGIAQDAWRFSLSDHIDSTILELDGNADIITFESYFPFGGTAYVSARTEIESAYKYRRYSGKERDATGLYAYGQRYYAPWLSRWINPDPAGPLDGWNLFSMVGNNPVNRRDVDGLMTEDRAARILQRGFRRLTQSSARSLRRPATRAASTTGDEPGAKRARLASEQAPDAGDGIRRFGPYRKGLTHELDTVVLAESRPLTSLEPPLDPPLRQSDMDAIRDRNLLSGGLDLQAIHVRSGNVEQHVAFYVDDDRKTARTLDNKIFVELMTRYDPFRIRSDHETISSWKSRRKGDRFVPIQNILDQDNAGAMARNPEKEGPIRAGILAGNYIPPISVIRMVGGKKFRLRDGRNRMVVARELNLTHVPVDVYERPRD